VAVIYKEANERIEGLEKRREESRCGGVKWKRRERKENAKKKKEKVSENDERW
jgi:hypothetical protein